ncbi:MAG: helix-turn-helix domain-containing protein [Deltaproteobacteria bacterium]|nr:helix-turn-helix domain-containing protein [Deltaproteobacteria bacterium]
MEPCAATENRYWDIRDLSHYLKVKIKTLYALVPVIPHYRVGKLIRFRKEEIDTWMEHKRGIVCEQGRKSENHRVRGIGKGNPDIDRLIRKAIDQTKGETYNLITGNQTGSRDPKGDRHGSI